MSDFKSVSHLKIDTKKTKMGVSKKEERENEIRNEKERKMKEKKRESHGHWAMGRRKVRSLTR